MRNVKLGTKRQCHACGARFYDLGKRPVVCVQCGAEVDLNRLAKRKAAAKAEASAEGTREDAKPKRSASAPSAPPAPARPIEAR
jgi:uncharacterized protein (TIGR02300 family)